MASHPARVRSDRFPSRAGRRACLSLQPYSPPLGLSQPRRRPSRSRHRTARGQLHLTEVEWRVVSNLPLDNQTRLDVSVNDTTKEMVADAYLTRLGERGIEYVFANAGTDFAPIVESLSRNVGNKKFPRFITVPHENVAMAMAHGYYRTAGKPAAVIV